MKREGERVNFRRGRGTEKSQGAQRMGMQVKGRKGWVGCQKVVVIGVSLVLF